MTQTLAQLVTTVRFRGDFRNVIRFPTADIEREIQAAFGEFYELVVDTNEGYYDTFGNVTTTASVAFVAAPTGAWRIRGVDRLDGTEFCPLRQVSVMEGNRYGTTPGRPEAFRLTARGIDLYSIPDAVYTLRVTYTPVAPTLSATPTEFFNGWEEYAIFGALVRLAGPGREQTSEWQAQCDRQRERVTRAASGRKNTGPEYLNLYEDYVNPDEVWR